MKRGLLMVGSVTMLLAAACIGRAQALPAGTVSQKDIEYANADGKSFSLDVYHLPGANALQPVIIRIAPQRETPSGAAGDLLAAGYTLVYVGYMPTTSTGKVFDRYPADILSARKALHWVADNASTLHIDVDRIGLWGAGNGASIAALLGVMNEVPPPKVPAPRIRAMCLFEGITDWRNAELYGDESANIPGSPAYQLFGGNPKEHPDDARMASAVNYIRPTSPGTLMVTLSSDEQRAMHLIFAEALKRAGVASALYEEPLAAAAVGGGGHAIDEAKLNLTVMEFFNDILKGDRGNAKSMTLDQEVDQLIAAGLFKQARRIIDEQIALIGGAPGGDAAALPARDPWLKKLRQINEKQQEPALLQLINVKKSLPHALENTRTLFTIREVLTDPERIGQYTVETTIPQKAYTLRADALKFVEILNGYILKNDIGSAERQAALMRDMMAKGDADPAMLKEFLYRSLEIRGKRFHVWPHGVRRAVCASDLGQDLYGYWMDLKAGGEVQRFRYIPAGHFTMGSSLDEWGRLPNEPILEPTDIPKAFWMGESLVTQAMWEGVMGADENHSAFNKSGEVRLKLPAENLSYAHAINFLNKLGVDARLPTEAEWEYACRAGSTGMVAGTGRLSDMAWFWDEARANGTNPAAPVVDDPNEADVRILHDLDTDRTDMARLTHPVKQKLPNRWGLYDMQGNVWEWCSGTSPLKPRDFHPARGGSWLSIPQSCRAARDVWFSVEQQTWNLGLRILIPVQ